MRQRLYESVLRGDPIEAVAVGFSDDGLPVSSSSVMRVALQYSKMFNGFCISHLEDCSLCREGVMHEGKVSAVLGLRGYGARKRRDQRQP